MINLAKRETKLMIAVHGWSAIVLGLLLYAVVLTGMMAVFADEIGIWSAGRVQTVSAFQRPIDRSIRDLAARTPVKYHDDINLFEVGDHGLGAFFHRDEVAKSGEPISRGIYYQLDTADKIISAREGTSEEVFGPRNDDALSSFLVDTHVRLHLPNPWGLILTGILGLAMLVAAISGLLIHRHLFTNIFTLRKNVGSVLVARDRHSVAGTWSLPFAFVLAFTGSFFSFFGTVGVPIVAMAAFGGDQQAMNEAIYGNPVKPDATATRTGNLDRIARDPILRAGEIPTFMTIEKLGRADASVTTYHPAGEGAIVPVSLGYHGATAAFDRIKPLIGARPSFGGSAAGMMSPLHFGNFFGVLSKAVWFGLGFAMCYVTLSGLRLWLVRRRDQQRSLDWLERATTVVGFGLPFALALSAAAFLLSMPRGSAVFWTPAAFLIASAIAITAGVFMRTNARLGYFLQRITGATLVALPFLRLVMGGPGWPMALAAGQPVIMAVDIAVGAAGCWILWQHSRISDRKLAPLPAALKRAE
ncbi:PepSY domain-containing protein [Sphingomonas sp.]|uniref:PepSY-associated TM helix domain-containing protein n=1 Tax=Sphingomonas sp. TaxID=28214 RepID=UPI0025F239C4|nr:PepSY-associated TM helix domain-containing protein [Sphingomonas sp.]